MVNSSFVHSGTHLFEENAAFHQSSKKTGEKASHPVFFQLGREIGAREGAAGLCGMWARPLLPSRGARYLFWGE
ncbi:hypothetical protein B1694_07370 [Geobacillus zalihae]|nr:hypothetical protein B1693_09150 [Geobacillus zalihae]OQP23770.1 hypothetical protein B1694_07370 [Geobacillus zalihae]